MARAKRNDDDDDDFVPTVGRPRSPEQFGPPRPQSHEREEYFKRLASILYAVEIHDVPRDVRLWLQFLLCRCDRLRAIDAERFTAKGEEQVTLLLRTVFESTNGAAALTLPILRAVNVCTLPQWVDRGLEWIEAFDVIDLVQLHATLSELGLEDQLDRVLRRKLERILGAPKAPAVPKKPPTRTMARPPNVSAETWAEVMEMHKAAKRETQLRRKARMAA